MGHSCFESARVVLNSHTRHHVGEQCCVICSCNFYKFGSVSETFIQSILRERASMGVNIH